MTATSRRSWVLFVFLIAAARASAQDCRGLGSFRATPLQLSANTESSTGVRSYSAGLAVGGAGPFAGIELGAIDVAAFNAASKTLGVTVGYQVPLNPRGTAQLCPIVQVLSIQGPQDINGTGVDYSEHDVSVGVTAGFRPAHPKGSVVAVPTVALLLENAFATFSGAAQSVSNSEWMRLRVGLGVLFGQEFAIKPDVSLPFGVGHTTTTFGVTAAFALGGHRAPVIVDAAATSCAGRANTDSSIYDSTEVTERARLRTAPEPAYPPLERDRGMEGRVILTLVVLPNGAPDVTSVQLTEGADPAFDNAALRWIGSVSYWPACRDGQPVRTRIVQPVDFCALGCRHINGSPKKE